MKRIVVIQLHRLILLLLLLNLKYTSSSYRRRPPSVPQLQYYSKSRKLSDTDFLVEFEIEPHANLGIVATESHEIIDFQEHHDGFVGIAGDSGHLEIGDVLISINGVNIQTMSSFEASRVFKRASRVEPGQNSVKYDLIFRRRLSSSSKTEEEEKDDDDSACHLHLFFSHKDAVKTHETYSKQEHRERPVLLPAKLADFGLRPEGRLARAKIIIPESSVFGCHPYKSLQQKQNTMVLVRRGQCSYQDKVRHASRAGFMGVLIWNDEDEMVEMHGDKDDIETKQITVAMLSYSSGRKIVNMITRSRLDVEVVLHRSSIDEDDDATYFEEHAHVYVHRNRVLTLEIMPARFSGDFPDHPLPLNVLPDDNIDACDSSKIEGVEGVAVVTRRGGCTFADKYVNLVLRGHAAAVLVVNNHGADMIRMELESWRVFPRYVPTVMITSQGFEDLKKSKRRHERWSIVFHSDYVDEDEDEEDVFKEEEKEKEMLKSVLTSSSVLELTLSESVKMRAPFYGKSEALFGEFLLRVSKSSCEIDFDDEEQIKIAVVLLEGDKEEFSCDIPQNTLLLDTDVLDPIVVRALRALRSSSRNDLHVRVLNSSRTTPCDSKLWSRIWELADVHKWPRNVRARRRLLKRVMPNDSGSDLSLRQDALVELSHIASSQSSRGHNDRSEL